MDRPLVVWLDRVAASSSGMLTMVIASARPCWREAVSFYWLEIASSASPFAVKDFVAALPDSIDKVVGA
jgi:hypothetical protein